MAKFRSTVAENDEEELDESAVPTQQPTDRIGLLNKALPLLQAKNYGLRKIRRLECRLSASIKRTVGVDLCLSPEVDAESTIIKQLKEKFNSSLNGANSYCFTQELAHTKNC